MTRTLTSRGLAVVFTCLALAGWTAGTASATPSAPPCRPVLAVGTWSDPGPTISNITPAGDKYDAELTGSTTTVGRFSGVSTYHFDIVFDPTANTTVGDGQETFTATIDHRGSGHVTFAEHLQVQADGSELITGVVLAGDGVFAGAHGVIVFSATTTDTTGSSPQSGSYLAAMVLAAHI